MARYRMRYKDDDNVTATYGEFDSEADALGWWKTMTTDDEPEHGPHDGVVERYAGGTWVIVASPNASQ